MTMDIEIPLELVDNGMWSLTYAWSTKFNGVGLNPSNYDGESVKYYFEAKATNNDTSAVAVDLRVGSTTLSTLSFPSGANKQRLISEEFTPQVGDNFYVVRCGATTNQKEVCLWDARIIIIIKAATKARICIPLTEYDYACSHGRYVGSSSSTTYEVESPLMQSQWWKKEATKYATISDGDCWTLEATLAGLSGETGYLALYNVTKNTMVEGAELSVSDTDSEGQYVTVSFPDDATNFDDGDVYEVRVKTAAGGSMTYGAARLYLQLENPTKAQIPYRIQRGKWTDHHYNPTFETHRTQVNLSNYENPTIYFESTGYCADSNTTLYLCDDGTTDDGTYHPHLSYWDGIEDTEAPTTDVTGASLKFNSATKVQKRTSAISLTDGNRYFTRRDDATSDYCSSGVFLIIDTTTSESEPDPEPEPIPVTPLLGGGGEERSHGWI